MNEKTLKGKTAVVTGGSRGIGKAVSLKLASYGANIAVIFAGNEEAANEIVKKIKNEYKVEAKAYRLDVSDFNACKETVAEIKNDFGSVHILINNAGITRDGLLAMMKEKYGYDSAFLCPSGTAALEMGVVLADLKPGDEVILPSYTFSSTVNAVVLFGGFPVFCEVDPKTMNIDYTKIEALITPKTKMIMPIDYAGVPCDIDFSRMCPPQSF